MLKETCPQWVPSTSHRKFMYMSTLNKNIRLIGCKFIIQQHGEPLRDVDLFVPRSRAMLWTFYFCSATQTIPSYNKLYSSSGLRLLMSADSRSYYHDSGSYDPCCRHYFNINGGACTDPGTIEGINYLNKRTNLHRPNLSKCDMSEFGLPYMVLLTYSPRWQAMRLIGR